MDWQLERRRDAVLRFFRMSQPAKKPATRDDLFRIPDNMTGQIIDGELHAHPRPAIRHARVGSSLGGGMWGPFQKGRGGRGGWWIYFEPEVHLGSNIVVPDLAGWRKERVPDEPTADEKFMTLRPDWVCEVLSPSTTSFDRVKKRRVYEQAEIPWLWFVDPVGRTLDAWAWKDGGYSVALGTWGPGEKPRVQPFHEIELELDEIWGPAPADYQR